MIDFLNTGLPIIIITIVALGIWCLTGGNLK